VKAYFKTSVKKGKPGYSMAIRDFCGIILFFSRTSRIPFLKTGFCIIFSSRQPAA